MRKNEEKQEKWLNDEFNHCYGTSCYYNYILTTVLTDGTKELAEKHKCFWLIDIIAFAQKISTVRDLKIQFWELRKTSEKTCIIEATADTGLPPVYKKVIKFTDIAGNVKIWAQPNIDADGKRIIVIFLPSEY